MKKKGIKIGSSLVLATSLLAVTTVGLDADAASKYKISGGKLIVKSTKKVATGYVTYNKILYYNGTKFTGLYKSKYYKSGVKGTGIYKSKYYKSGSLATGIYKSKYYKKGVLGTGTYKSKYYKDGSLFTGIYNSKYYKSGVKATGTYKDKFYKSGTLFTGTYKGKYYSKGVLLTDYHLVSGKLYKGASVATGIIEYSGKYYKDGIAAQHVKFESNDIYNETHVLKDSNGKTISKYDDGGYVSEYILTAGSYTFTATADGYDAYTKTIKVDTSEAEKSYTFSMDEASNADEEVGDDEDDSSYQDDDEEIDEDEEVEDDEEIEDDDEESDDEEATTDTYVSIEADDIYDETLVLTDSEGNEVEKDDDGGYISFYYLPAGTYTFTATADGYETYTKTITITGTKAEQHFTYKMKKISD